jgi:hypothetical protein
VTHRREERLSVVATTVLVGQERQRQAPELAARQPGSAWVPLREDPVRTSCVDKRGSPGVSRGVPHPGRAIMSVKIDQSSLHVLPIHRSGRLACVTYAPGHNVHWIQALRSSNDKEASTQTWSGIVTDVGGEVVTIRKPDGSLARFRTHDPARLVLILRRKGVKVTVNDRYAIMRAGFTRNGSTCLSVQADKGEPLGACTIADLPPSATALETSGGDDD